jgi:hypothetical protein
MSDLIACCSDWEPEFKKINGPIILAQARNPYLTETPAFHFKPWKFCPWCGEDRDALAHYIREKSAEIESKFAEGDK